jgi:hypothetical protein
VRVYNRHTWEFILGNRSSVSSVLNASVFFHSIIEGVCLVTLLFQHWKREMDWWMDRQIVEKRKMSINDHLVLSNCRSTPCANHKLFKQTYIYIDIYRHTCIYISRWSVVILVVERDDSIDCNGRMEREKARKAWRKIALYWFLFLLGERSSLSAVGWSFLK